MPKSPILDRTLYFARNLDGSFRDLDFALVNTSLGAMAEPVSLNYTDGCGNLQAQDAVDMSYNRRLEVDETLLFSLLGTYGVALPQNLNDPSS